MKTYRNLVLLSLCGLVTASGCRVMPWMPPRIAHKDRPSMHQGAQQDPGSESNYQQSPYASIGKTSQPAAQQHDPAEMAQVLEELRVLSANDPIAYAQLTEDLKVTPVELWPGLVQSFRSTMAYRDQYHQRIAQQQPQNWGKSPYTQFASDEQKPTPSGANDGRAWVHGPYTDSASGAPAYSQASAEQPLPPLSLDLNDPLPLPQVVPQTQPIPLQQPIPLHQPVQQSNLLPVASEQPQPPIVQPPVAQPATPATPEGAATSTPQNITAALATTGPTPAPVEAASTVPNAAPNAVATQPPATLDTAVQQASINIATDSNPAENTTAENATVENSAATAGVIVQTTATAIEGIAAVTPAGATTPLSEDTTAQAPEALAATATPLAATPSAASAEPVAWQTGLNKAIAKLEAAVTESPNTLEETTPHVSLRMLYLIAGRRDDALKPIPGISDTEQAFWNKQLHGLSVYLDNTQADQRANESVNHLREALNRLSQSASLVVRNLNFCTEVNSYGVFKTFESTHFSPGQEVLLYAEIENFTSEATEYGYHTALKSHYQIVDQYGNKVIEQEFETTEEYCLNQRRDFFVRYFLWLPKVISSGEYVLQLTIEDLKGQKLGQANIPFTIDDAGKQIARKR